MSFSGQKLSIILEVYLVVQSLQWESHSLHPLFQLQDHYSEAHQFILAPVEKASL